jgi:hypothetical protein
MKSADELLAHAWVEVGGHPVGALQMDGSEIEKFSPLEVPGPVVTALRFTELMP